MKAWKVFLGLGAGVLVIGLIVLIIGLGLNGWTFKAKYEMLTYVQQEDCQTLDLNLAAGEMNVEFYTGDKIEIEYPASYRYGYEVSEKSGTLSVSPQKQFGIRFGFWWNKIPAVTVRVPNLTNKAVNLKFNVSAGKAKLDYGFFRSVNLTLSAGTVNIGKMTCTSFTANVSAGTAAVNSLSCSGTLQTKLSAGSLNIGNIVCGSIYADVSAGSATFAVAGARSEYNITVDKSAGSCNVAGQYVPNSGKLISISLSAGSCNVTFTD